MNEIVPAYQVFEGELLERKTELDAILPDEWSSEQFLKTAVVAVRHNLELLAADRSSLHVAVNKAAMDGLRPDGKEGVILIRNTKVGETYIKQAVWQPMVFGIRKRARELEGVIINAEVVHENDEFVWRKGDDPSISHIPAQLGADPGKMIGCYAIFKNEDGILHREVMDANQIASVKSISKQPNGLLWGKFTAEAWKKSVVHRGAKTVPFSDKLRTIIGRHEDMFDLTMGSKQTLAVPSLADFPNDNAAVTEPDQDDKGADAILRELETQFQAVSGNKVAVGQLENDWKNDLVSMNEDDRLQAMEMIEAAKAGSIQ